MSRTFKFSKGSFEVDGLRVVGTIKASASMQQSPGDLAIDTAIENFGPISINEVTQFRHVFSSVGFCLFIAIGCLVGEGILMCSSGLGGLMESLERLSSILPISFLIGVVVYIVIFLKFKIYMAQFSNGGQTVYVPYIKKKDWVVLEELNGTIYELKHKSSK